MRGSNVYSKLKLPPEIKCSREDPYISSQYFPKKVALLNIEHFYIEQKKNNIMISVLNP